MYNAYFWCEIRIKFTDQTVNVTLIMNTKQDVLQFLKKHLYIKEDFFVNTF